jgi:alginate O-acetyltransferase complex protein AlgI
VGFTSLAFFLFFTFAVGCYFLLSEKWRWVGLLIISYLFYMSWGAEYLIVLVSATLICYFMACRIGEETNPAKKRMYLFSSLAILASILFSFKYINMFASTINTGADLLHIDFKIPWLNIIAPIGLSFYSLQLISYMVDVYKGAVEPERHLGIFALYVSFFPQILAGPIARAKQLMPQIRQNHRFNEQQVVSGLSLVLWGVFQKVVIADRLALLVNQVYDSPSEYQGLTILVATYFFWFQIYCDFAGYTSIARGVARVFGFDLVKNFNRPYLSKDFNEFWNRWHISLSNWLRDYIFFPIMRVFRRRWPKGNIITNLLLPSLLTLLISGLWHGSGWNFVVWGILHGIILFVSAWTKPWRGRIFSQEKWKRLAFFADFFQILITFNMVSFAWIFFRAENLNIAILILKRLLVIEKLNISLDVVQVYLGMILIMILLLGEFIVARGKFSQWFGNRHVIVRWAMYLLAIYIILFFGVAEEANFIYAQF